MVGVGRIRAAIAAMGPVLFLIAGSAAYGWSGKRDLSGIAPGMSPAEIQKINRSCRPLDQVKKLRCSGATQINRAKWSAKYPMGSSECSLRSTAMDRAVIQ
jgi:hypothetical protein